MGGVTCDFPGCNLSISQKCARCGRTMCARHIVWWGMDVDAWPPSHFACDMCVHPEQVEQLFVDLTRWNWLSSPRPSRKHSPEYRQAWEAYRMAWGHAYDAWLAGQPVPRPLFQPLPENYPLRQPSSTAGASSRKSSASGDKPRSVLAIWSLVFSITGWFLPYLVFTIVGLVLGYMSLSKIKRSQGALTGRGMAMAGLIIGYLFVGFVALILIISAATGSIHVW